MYILGAKKENNEKKKGKKKRITKTPVDQITSSTCIEGGAQAHVPTPHNA
jgi:hypothetical protein